MAADWKLQGNSKKNLCFDFVSITEKLKLQCGPAFLGVPGFSQQFADPRQRIHSDTQFFLLRKGSFFVSLACPA